MPLPNHFQGGVFEDDGAVHVVSVEAHIDAGVVATAVSLDDDAVSVLGMANACTDVIRILIRILAVFIIDDTRAARDCLLYGRDFYRIAIDDMLVVFLDGGRNRRRT